MRRQYDWLYILTVILLCIMIVLAAMAVIRKCSQIDAEYSRVVGIIEAAKRQQIDYYAALPARERPIVVLPPQAGPEQLEPESAEPGVTSP